MLACLCRTINKPVLAAVIRICLAIGTIMKATYEELRQLNEQAWVDRNKDVQKSLKTAQKVQAMLGDYDDASILDLVLSLRTQGYCLDHLSRYSEALTTARRAMELANQVGDLRIVASIDNVLGNIFWRLADYSSSLDHYMHGLRLVKVEPDPELEVFLLQGLGVLHFEIGDFEEALKYFRDSIQWINSRDITGQAIGLNNTAYTLHRMKRNEEALPFALQALELYGNESFSVGWLELLHTLGSIYLEMGDIERSSWYFQEVAQAAENQEKPLQTINALFGITQIHQTRGEMEDALQKLLRILAISQDIGSLASEGSARELLAQLYKQMGNYQAALENYEIFHSIHVKIFNEQAERRVHNIRLLLQVENIQKEADVYRLMAATDTLTGLLSRREFFSLGEKAVDRARLERASISILMVDLDNFKAINDQHGHAVGDQVLAIVARRIKNTLRQDDLAGRYGGDEFVILMPEIGMPACQKIAERCRTVVAEEPIDIGPSRFWMNISVGLVFSDSVSTFQLEDLIQQADKALLLAKKCGRNRLISSELI